VDVPKGCSGRSWPRHRRGRLLSSVRARAQGLGPERPRRHPPLRLAAGLLQGPARCRKTGQRPDLGPLIVAAADLGDLARAGGGALGHREPCSTELRAGHGRAHLRRAKLGDAAASLHAGERSAPPSPRCRVKRERGRKEMSLRVRAGAAKLSFCTGAGAAASVGFDPTARAHRPPLGPW